MPVRFIRFLLNKQQLLSDQSQLSDLLLTPFQRCIYQRSVMPIIDYLNRFLFDILIILLLICMKKSRADSKAAPTPISLSSKRASLNHEQLFQPYKIDWKGAPLQNVDNNSSKVFFQNMKAELSTIKNDFEKLIRKEITLKNDKEEPPKSSSLATKNKCMSANKKEERRCNERYGDSQKFEIALGHRDYEDSMNRILNLERNLPCSSQTDIKQVYTKTVQLKQTLKPSAKSVSPFEQVEIFDHKSPLQSTRTIVEERSPQFKEMEAVKMKEIVARLHDELAASKKEAEVSRSLIIQIDTQKNMLMGKMEELSTELSLKIQLAVQQEEKINAMAHQLEKLQQGGNQLAHLEQEFNNQRAFYNEKINELVFHNQNLGNINMQLGEENQILKENMFNLQNFAEDVRNRYNELDCESKKKQEYLSKDIQQYQKREDMFTREIDRLTKELSSRIEMPLTITEQKLCPACTGETSNGMDLHEEIFSLKDEISHLKKQVEIEKEIHTTLSAKYQQQIQNFNIQKLSREFEEKVSELIEENCRLKNRLNFCESTLESLQLQNGSYVQQIALYEQRERTLAMSKKMSSSEWEEMAELIDRLKEENRRLVEEMEFRNLKKEVEVGSEFSAGNQENWENLLKMANSQLFQNQQLKDTIRQLAANVRAVEGKLEGFRLQNSKLQEELSLYQGSAYGEIPKMKARHEQLYASLQKKDKQLQNLKDLLLKVVVQKVNKREDEDEIDYFLREIDQRAALL